MTTPQLSHNRGVEEQEGSSRLTAQSVESVHSKQREDSTPLHAPECLSHNGGEGDCDCLAVNLPEGWGGNLILSPEAKAMGEWLAGADPSIHLPPIEDILEADRNG